MFIRLFRLPVPPSDFSAFFPPANLGNSHVVFVQVYFLVASVRLLMISRGSEYTQPRVHHRCVCGLVYACRGGRQRRVLQAMLWSDLTADSLAPHLHDEHHIRPPSVNTYYGLPYYADRR